MPEGRPFPYKFFPRLRQSLSISFGEPIPSDAFLKALEVNGASLTNTKIDPTNAPSDAHRSAFRPAPWLVPQRLTQATGKDVPVDEVQRVRSAVTKVIQDAVEGLGRKVSGNHLGKPGADL